MLALQALSREQLVQTQFVLDWEPEWWYYRTWFVKKGPYEMIKIYLLTNILEAFCLYSYSGVVKNIAKPIKQRLCSLKYKNSLIIRCYID